MSDDGEINVSELKAFFEKAAIDDKNSKTLIETNPEAILYFLKNIMDFTDLTIDDPAVFFLSHHPPEDIIEIMSTDGNSKAMTKLSIITEIQDVSDNPSPEEKSYYLENSQILRQNAGKSIEELQLEFAARSSENTNPETGEVQTEYTLEN